jgi:hypothetical protein
MNKILLLFFLIFLLFLPQRILAQNLLSPNLVPERPEEIILRQMPRSPFNYPEIDWFVLESPHFLVYFDKRKHSEVARDVARIAEDCYGPITRRLGHKPAAKTHIIILDTSDYSNGFADPAQQKIIIWLTHLDSSLRGTHKWLETVISHEFTHIVHLDIMSGVPARLVKIFGPGFFRPGEFVPSWFLEGLAQDTSEVGGGEFWDSHRDMILRSITLEDKLLSYDRMGVYGKNGLGNELVYNQGYSLVKYVREKYGEEKIASILEGKGHNYLSLKRNMYYRLQDTPHELYRDWKIELARRYQERTKGMRPDGDIEDLVSWGWSDRHPVFSPTSNKVAFLSNKNKDYEKLSLYLLDLDSKKHKRLARKANPDASFSYDGQKLVYSRNRLRWQGSVYGDLYIIDFSKLNKQKRLTRGMRARQPHLSPDGRKIVFVKNDAGKTNICLFNLATEEVSYLTANENYTQYFTPRFSPDGKRIVFSRFKDAQRDICLMKIDDLRIVSLTNDRADDRDPCWSRDGKRILFASDRTGIFNIYELNLETNNLSQLTDVIGGAFEPSGSAGGERIVFSSYSAAGFDIKILDRRLLEETKGKKKERLAIFAPPLDREKGGKKELSAGKEYSVKKYRSKVKPILWMPLGMSVKGYAQDIMGKDLFEGAVGYGAPGGLAGYAYYINRHFFPNLLIGAYDYSLSYTNYVEGANQDNLRDDYWERRRGGAAGLGLPLVPVGYLLLGYEAYFVDDLEVERDINPPTLPDDGHIAFCGASLMHSHLKPTLDMDINPQGRKLVLSYALADESYGSDFNFNKYMFDWREYIPLYERHTLALRVLGGFSRGHNLSQGAFQLGGMEDLRGYAVRSFRGDKVGFWSAEYRFPLLEDIGKRSLFLYLDRLYGMVFVDSGRAWFDGRLAIGDFDTDAGCGARLKSFVFYHLPLNLELSLAHGFDDYEDIRPWLGASVIF